MAITTAATGASLSSPYPSSTPQWKYEVFLSLRGMDTRRGFTDHLYAALLQNIILTFWDDEELERGKPIKPELLKALEESRHESEFIEHIVEEMMDKLSSKSSSITKNFIGIESTVAKLIPSYLGFENKVYMIGIYGMGGLGKTNLARVIYDEFHSHFEGSSFIANVRKFLKQHGLPRLEQQLLANILEDIKIDIRNVYEGVEMIKKRLS